MDSLKGCFRLSDTIKTDNDNNCDNEDEHCLN